MNIASNLDESTSAASSALEDAGRQLQVASEQTMDYLRDVAEQLSEQASRASERAAAYAKEEPVNALLIAAGAGAMLMGLFSLMARSRD